MLLAYVLLVVYRDAVIRRVTSRSLGSLAPGYAATPRGYLAYAGLVGDLGVMALALDLTTRSMAGIYLLVASVAIFVVASIWVIVGEVRTYRALKR